MVNTFFHYHQHRINYHSAGQGELLVFLHGWPTNAHLWQAQMDYFSQHYRTVALDWLGFGESDKPLQHPYTFTHKKEILAALLAEILPADEQVTLIGHDIGGPPAILWSSENPQRVKRLILLNTVVYPFSTLLDRVSHFFFKLPLVGPLMVSPLGLRYVMKSITKNKDRETSAKIRAILLPYQTTNPRLKLKTILEPLEKGKKEEFLVLSKHFTHLQVDKHLIVAKGDPLCYAHMKKLQLENPTVPVYPLKKCGHYLPLERPAELNAILEKILH